MAILVNNKPVDKNVLAQKARSLQNETRKIVEFICEPLAYEINVAGGDNTAVTEASLAATQAALDLVEGNLVTLLEAVNAWKVDGIESFYDLLSGNHPYTLGGADFDIINAEEDGAVIAMIQYAFETARVKISTGSPATKSLVDLVKLEGYKSRLIPALKVILEELYRNICLALHAKNRFYSAFKIYNELFFHGAATAEEYIAPFKTWAATLSDAATVEAAPIWVISKDANLISAKDSAFLQEVYKTDGVYYVIADEIAQIRDALNGEEPVTTPRVAPSIATDVTSIDLNGPTTATLTLTPGMADDGVTPITVTASGSDDLVATVSGTTITPVSVGTITVTGTASDAGSVTGSPITITVVDTTPAAPAPTPDAAPVVETPSIESIISSADEI